MNTHLPISSTPLAFIYNSLREKKTYEDGTYIIAKTPSNTYSSNTKNHFHRFEIDREGGDGMVEFRWI